MYIYNVTTNIEESVHDEWLAWMNENHIPDVMATGKFLSAKMAKVLVEEDMGGITYSVQFTTVDKETLEKYVKMLHNYSPGDLYPLERNWKL